MVKRVELLHILESNSQEDVVNFVKQCCSENAGCLSETLGSCSRSQLDQIWEALSQIFSPNLLILPGMLEIDEGSDLVKAIDCLTSLLTAMLSLTDLHVPDSMYNVASLLQETIPNLPSALDKTKNNIARVFEHWWKKDLHGRDGLIMSSFVYILARSLDLKPKPLVCDMKRVWSLHEVLKLVELQNDSSEEFRMMLLRCYISPLYMQHDEGLKFLAYVMTLNDEFTGTIHSTIRHHLLSVQRSWWEKYGEIYFRAWHSGSLRERIEVKCIQDFMHHAVHAQPVLAPALKKLLSYIHAQRKQTDVEDMLYRLYEPIIWRALRVPNHQIRGNAAALFFDLFPLQSSELPVARADSLLQQQFDLFQELLDDPFPSVRCLSVLGVFRAMNKYWEVIPQDVLKNLTVKLVQDLLNDTSSADVRESVVKGLTILLDNKLCHLFLKPILPEIRNSFHDVSEKVRIAMLELLKKVKCLRAIQYWSIVPVKHLLARLVVDSDPVNRRIMKVIFGNFLPIEASSNEQLERCIALIKLNPAAARQFFRYAPEHMNLQDTVNYISMLCRAVLTAMEKSGFFADNNSSQEKENVEDTEKDEDDDLHVTNTALMKGFFEAMCIMWTVSEDQLKKASNAHLAKSLHKKFSYALPEMMKAFTDTEIVHTLMAISAFLPPNYIPFLSRSWLPKLRGMATGASEEDYGELLELLCKGGRACDAIELIIEWLTPSLADKENTSLNKSQRSENTSLNKSKRIKKRVGFVDPREPQPKLGLEMISHLLKNTVTQNILLRDNIDDMVTLKSLQHQCLDKLEVFFNSDSDNSIADPDILTQSFSTYCKLAVLLQGKNQTEASGGMNEFEEILWWTDKHVLPLLSVKVEEDTAAHTRRKATTAREITSAVLNIFNNIMLVGVGSCGLCNKLVDFCITCLTVDDDLELLPLSMLCIYQVTEYLQYVPDADTEINNTIPNALSRVLVTVAGYVKSHPTGCQQLLDSVKLHVGELMKVVFCRLSLNASLLHDVMGTVMAATLAELAFHSQNENLADDVGQLTLPPLSGWLLDIIGKNKPVYKYFLEDLNDTSESGALNNVHKIHGAVQILLYLSSGRSVERASLRELCTVLHRHLEATKQGMSDEQMEEYKTVIVCAEDKIKNCRQILQVEAAEPDTQTCN